MASSGNCGGLSYLLNNGCTTLNPVMYPAANPNVFAVGATTSSDDRASFSSYGWFVDVSAPGYDIYSTLWDNTYDYKSGTSMASPLVSGLASLVWSRNPGLSNGQVASAIANTAEDLGQSGRDDEHGYGRVDAAAAVRGATGQQIESFAERSPDLARQSVGADAPVQPGIVLVKLKPTLAASAHQAFMTEQGLTVTGEVRGLGVVKVSVPAGQEREVAASLSSNPAVEYAEPDYMVSVVW